MIRPDWKQRRRAIAAGEWLKGERERLGWSIERLCEEAQTMADVHHLDPDVLNFGEPNPKQVVSLEEGRETSPPRWLRGAFHAIESADLTGAERGELRGARSWFWGKNPWNASCPMVFYNEYRLIERLGAYFSVDQRRAIEQFVAEWHSPYPGRKAKALQRMADELGFEARLVSKSD